MVFGEDAITYIGLKSGTFKIGIRCVSYAQKVSMIQNYPLFLYSKGLMPT